MDEGMDPGWEGEGGKGGYRGLFWNWGLGAVSEVRDYVRGVFRALGVER